MSTPNFAISHRCVVVSNDDFEIGNVPEMEKKNIGDRSYPSYELSAHNDNLLYHAIVVTCGYYSDANIDYIDLEDNSIEYNLLGRYIDDYSSKKELFDDIETEIASYDFAKKISRWRIEKLCRGKKIEDCPEVLDEYFKDLEAKICDKRIDGIKQLYGYEEYGCSGIFSNGEAIYSKIA